MCNILYEQICKYENVELLKILHMYSRMTLEIISDLEVHPKNIDYVIKEKIISLHVLYTVVSYTTIQHLVKHHFDRQYVQYLIRSSLTIGRIFRCNVINVKMLKLIYSSMRIDEFKQLVMNISQNTTMSYDDIWSTIELALASSESLI
jgi:hypothetical protein